MAFWLILAVVAIGLSIASIALRPHPKRTQPDETKELESPTAGEGHYIPVVWGDVTLEAPNVLWWGDKSTVTYKEKLKD